MEPDASHGDAFDAGHLTSGENRRNPRGGPANIVQAAANDRLRALRDFCHGLCKPAG